MAAQKMGAILFAVLLGPAFLGGCIVNPCGATKATGTEWYQSGLFEAFPPPGKTGGYSVSYQEPPTFFDEVKNAQKTNGDGNYLTVWRDNRTHWSIARHTVLSQTATAGALNKTFEDLGLPPPAPSSWTFRWGDLGC
jgi:hypothetical protein